jgi:hypothetical protein
MNRKLAMVLTTALLAVPVGAVAAGALTPASATAATAACTRNVTKTTPPTAPTAYSAGAAGSVTVGPGAGGLKVVSVAPNSGWKFRVDTAHGSSVDVFFRMGTTRIKFEASIEAPHRMRILVRTCG